MTMSSLAEIESAVEALPQPEQRELLSRLTAMIEGKGKEGAGLSLHERMKSGCGIMDSGISDLATNKKHMEGFGR